MTHFVLIALGILIAVLTVVAVLDLLPPLRIVPDDKHFDFTRFRRISFPISPAGCDGSGPRPCRSRNFL